jgi:hypothetical protein
MTRIMFAILACSLFLNGAAFAQEPLPGKKPIVQAIRNAYCPGVAPSEPCQTLAGSKALKLQFVKEVASAFGLGIFKKTSGEHCGGFSCDFVCALDGTFGYDILQDQESRAIAQWGWHQVQDVPGTAAKCVRPTSTPVPPEPEPPPSCPECPSCPPPVVCPICPPDLSAALATRTAERDQARRERDVCLAQPEPRCEAKLFGVIPVPCRVIR